jgi:hypothetical protein
MLMPRKCLCIVHGSEVDNQFKPKSPFSLRFENPHCSVGLRQSRDTKAAVKSLENTWFSAYYSLYFVPVAVKGPCKFPHDNWTRRRSVILFSDLEFLANRFRDPPILWSNYRALQDITGQTTGSSTLKALYSPIFWPRPSYMLYNPVGVSLVSPTN